jgi:hypothetical protein
MSSVRQSLARRAHNLTCPRTLKPLRATYESERERGQLKHGCEREAVPSDVVWQRFGNPAAMELGAL